jgi:tetratricopeptide (TPR) repeat protein
MKTLKNGFCVLLIIFSVVPLSLTAQNKEIPITTSSKEALDFLLKGRNKLENFEEPTAAVLFDKAIQKDPEFALAYLYRSQSGGGIVLFRQNLDKAVGLISKVSEGEKYEILYTQALADGNGLKRKEYLDRLLKLFPSDKRVQGIAGTYYYSITDFKNALIHFTKSASLDNKYAPSFNMIGYCQSALNNFKEAEKAFQTYIKLVPNSANGRDSYAELLLKMGKYDESIVQYKKALEFDATFSFSLIGMGNNFIFKGDYETARKYYKDYFDKTAAFSGKLAAMYWMAISFIYEGKVDKSISIFDEYRAMAVKENQITNAIMSYANQGLIFSEAGNPMEGYKCYQKAFDLIGKANLQEAVKENFNTYSLLWNYYALTAKGELDKAKAEAEKCKQKVESRKNPDEEMFLNSISAFFEIRKGNYDKAIEYFAKADREDPLNWYYNAVACNKKGDKQNASKLFEKVTKWNVNSLNLALVRNRAKEELKK